MAHHGHIEEFAGNADDWTAYAKRLEHYFMANEVTALEKKRAILLSCCGSNMYKLIRNLLSFGKVMIVRSTKLSRSLRPTTVQNRRRLPNNLNLIPAPKLQQSLSQSLWRSCGACLPLVSSTLTLLARCYGTV